MDKHTNKHGWALYVYRNGDLQRVQNCCAASIYCFEFGQVKSHKNKNGIQRCWKWPLKSIICITIGPLKELLSLHFTHLKQHSLLSVTLCVLGTKLVNKYKQMYYFTQQSIRIVRGQRCISTLMSVMWNPIKWREEHLEVLMDHSTM